MKVQQAIETYFPKLSEMKDLKEELMNMSSVHTFEKGTVLLKEGGYIKVIPLLLTGLIKVFKEEPVNGNEVLLYYIKPGESCVMSVTALIKNETSKVKVIVEETVEMVVIPADKALQIAKKYPKWNEFIYDLFNLKYEELLNVIEILTFSNKDTRLLEYLKKEAQLKNTAILHVTHQKIASDLGSSREVISRLLKKLETNGFVKLSHGGVEVVTE